MDERMNTISSSSVRDKSWTTEDVRKSSHHWTLAGDVALLNKLQDIAQNLVSMTHKVQQEVDTLVEDTSASHSKLGNVINEFIMLSNTQFVENRVYDDDVTDPTPTKKAPSNVTAEDQKTHIVAKVSEALRLGMSVIETAYEQLQVQNSDSEEESETSGGQRYTHEPILHPKDPYRCRPLPCVIGSSLFLEDDHVGIAAPLLSDEEHIEEDIKSVSSIEEDIEKHTKVLPKDYSSEEDLTINIDNGFSRSSERRNSQQSGDSDLFDPNKKNADNISEESHQESIEPIQKVTDFQKELASKLLPNKPHSSHANVEVSGAGADKSQGKNPSKSSSMNLKKGGGHEDTRQKNNFDDSGGDTHDEDDDYGLFTPKKGLFSAKGGLFDDSADEDDLFTEGKSSRSKGTSGSKLESKKSFFEANGNLSFEKSVDNLFADDGDADNHQNLLEPTNITKSPPTKKDLKEVHSLFSEVSDDSIFEIKSPTKLSTPTKKILPGAVSMFGSSVDPLAMRKPLKQTQSSSSILEASKAVINKKDTGLDDDFGRPSSETSSRSSRSVSSMRETKATTAGGGSGRQSPAPSVRSRASTTLFAEEPELDDLFSTTETTKRKPIGGISFFDDDDDNEEEDIFAPNVKLDIGKINKKLNNDDKENADKSPHLSDSASNFFDDIFAQIVKPLESTRRTSAVALFDDDIFSPSTIKNASSDSTMIASSKIIEPVQEKVKPFRKVSLFDDDDEDSPVDDLFVPTQISANKFGSSTAKISSSAHRQSLLFNDDDNLLFDTKTHPSSSSLLFNDDNLEVDLFDQKQSSGMKDDPKPTTSGTSEKVGKTSKEEPSLSKEKKNRQEIKKASTSVSKSQLMRPDDDEDVEDDLFAIGEKSFQKKDSVLEKTKTVTKSSDNSSPSGESETISLSPSKVTPKINAELKVADSLTSSSSSSSSISLSTKEGPRKDDGRATEKNSSSLTVKTDELSPSSGNLAESPRKKKPPVGGVALFGGALTPVLKQKTPRDKSPISSGESGRTESSTKPELRPISPFSFTSPILPRVNVVTMKQTVDFDNPVEANPLHNANKDRIKIPVKRRPPTRRGRQEAIRRSAIDMLVDDDNDGDLADDSELEISATVSAPTTPLTADVQKVSEFAKKLPTKVEEVVKVSCEPSFPMSNERLATEVLEAATLKHDAKKTTPKGGEKCAKNESSDSDGDGLFGRLTDKKTKKSKDSFDATSSSTLRKPLMSDLDADSSLGDDLFTSKLKSAKPMAKSDSDDRASLFGTTSSKSRPIKLGHGKSLFDDDDDDDEDIFKSPSTRKSSAISSSSKLSTRSSTKTNETKKDFDDPLMANKNN